MRVVVTGCTGLIGWHTHARLHAENCAAMFSGDPVPYDIVALDHEAFDDDVSLASALEGADAVLHCAGVNRAPDDELEAANPAIALRLTQFCRRVGVAPHIVYANSIHADVQTPYGRSKRHAGKIFEKAPGLYTNLILPHVFGEGARAFYNNVTATLINQILADEVSLINAEGQVRLLHVGVAAQAAIDAMRNRIAGKISPEPYPISVPDLYKRLRKFHDCYRSNIYPDLSEQFDRDLFNCYRAATYPDSWPRLLPLHTDARGILFEAVKGGGGQVFLSTTKPGVTRGDHFHLSKIERFLVVQGEATIRIRKVLSDKVWEYNVSGALPAPVDMPTLHTHSIENTGKEDLLTLFWTHDLFDASNPDTFADKVLQ